jgi:hypothetical protein
VDEGNPVGAGVGVGDGAEVGDLVAHIIFRAWLQPSFSRHLSFLNFCVLTTFPVHPWPLP